MLEIQFEKTSEKTYPFIPLLSPSLFIPLIRDEYRITRMKRRKIKTIMSSKVRISVHKHYTKIPLFVKKRYFENKV